LVAAFQCLASFGKHPEEYLAVQARREAARRAVDRLL